MSESRMITAEAITELENQAFSKFLLDSINLIDTLKHVLKGEQLEQELVEHRGEKVLVAAWKAPKNNLPPINQKGFNATLTKLQPLLDKITSSGNIREDECNLYTRFNMDTLAEMYVINFKEFGFRSTTEMDALLDTILTLLKVQLSKSIDMRLLKELFSRYSINEHKVLEEGPKKPQTNLTM